MRRFLVLMLLLLSEVYADIQRTPLTRWQAVRFTRLENSSMFRIDILELTDENPPRTDVKGISYLDGDLERGRAIEQTFQNFAKCNVESVGVLGGGMFQRLDGNLFASNKNERTVRLWGRDIMWHRHSIFVSEGSFEMKFVETNAVVTASGTVGRSPSDLPRLERMTFRAEYKARADMWKSWGFDRQDDMGESADYIIVGCSSVW